MLLLIQSALVYEDSTREELRETVFLATMDALNASPTPTFASIVRRTNSTLIQVFACPDFNREGERPLLSTKLMIRTQSQIFQAFTQFIAYAK